MQIYLYYKVVCGSVCLFPHISVSFVCMGLKLFRDTRGANGDGSYIKNSPVTEDITKEPSGILT